MNEWRSLINQVNDINKNEIINESRKEQYRKMLQRPFEVVNHYNKLLEGYNISRDLITRIFNIYSRLNLSYHDLDSWISDEESIISQLKRDDRIVWYLHQRRCMFLFKWGCGYFNVLRNEQNYSDPDIHRIINRAMSEIILLLRKYTKNEWSVENFKEHVWQSIGPRWDSHRQFLRYFEHYIGMFDLSSEMNNYVWNIDRPDMMLRSDLKVIEDEWKKKAKNYIVPKSADRILINFNNGWAWVLLPRPYCNDEARAMGHCGNSPRADSDDIVLSLRRIHNDTKHEPHLTFILEDGENLTEMKGKQNDKPTEKYHPYIVALLMHPLIKRIEGGGYLPENNFSVSDLSEELQDKLFAKRPEFMSFDYIIKKEGFSDRAKKKMYGVLRYLGIEDIEYNENYGFYTKADTFKSLDHAINKFKDYSIIDSMIPTKQDMESSAETMAKDVVRDSIIYFTNNDIIQSLFGEDVNHNILDNIYDYVGDAAIDDLESIVTKKIEDRALPEWQSKIDNYFNVNNFHYFIKHQRPGSTSASYVFYYPLEEMIKLMNNNNGRFSNSGSLYQQRYHYDDYEDNTFHDGNILDKIDYTDYADEVQYEWEELIR